MPALMEAPPAANAAVPGGFGIYVHWPFCASKCPYCDFNSHVRHQRIDEAQFVAAFRREAAHMAAIQPASSVDSIFFGGGTPSLMAPATVAGILETIAGFWPVRSDAEITLEANPSSVEAERFRSYRAAGVNRVSLGIQALGDDALRALGRLHSAAEAQEALKIAFATFERVSFDLIYARPDQSLDDWRQELSTALGLGSTHLSLYQLTIEDGTPFAALHRSGKLKTPDSELAAELYALTQDLTEAAGLPAYEISNHASPGQESRHNLVYWRSGLYVGLGPGAHGRLRTNGSRIALSNERHPETWVKSIDRIGHALIEQTPLAAVEAADEMLIMGLRLTEGVDHLRLQSETGLMIRPAVLARARRDGILAAAGHRLIATPRGRQLLNQLVLCLSEGLEPVPTGSLGDNLGSVASSPSEAGREP